MKKLALAIGLSLTAIISAFDHHDEWKLVVEQTNITAAAVEVTDFYANHNVYYYAVADKGVFLRDSLGTRLLTGESTGEQPLSLQSTSEMQLTYKNNRPEDLYAVSGGKLFVFAIGGDAPRDWQEIGTNQEISITGIISVAEGLLILSEDKKLYTVQDKSIAEVTIPEDVITGFDIVTPMRIGKEALFSDEAPQGAPWILFECSKGFIRKHIILSYPIENSTPVILDKTIQSTSEVLYGSTNDYTPIQAVSKGRKVTIEAYNEYMPTEGIRDIYFPEGTIITDMHVINRDFPVWSPQRIEMYTPVILFITTSIGSYSFGLRELMESDEPLYITEAPDEYLVLNDTIPSKKLINREISLLTGNYQFVINEKGISQYSAPYNDAVISPHDMPTKKGITLNYSANSIELIFPAYQSGTISLITLQGRDIASTSFVGRDRVTLSHGKTLAKGMYILSINSGSRTVQSKVLIK